MRTTHHIPFIPTSIQWDSFFTNAKVRKKMGVVVAFSGIALGAATVYKASVLTPAVLLAGVALASTALLATALVVLGISLLILQSNKKSLPQFQEEKKTISQEEVVVFLSQNNVSAAAEVYKQRLVEQDISFEEIIEPVVQSFVNKFQEGKITYIQLKEFLGEDLSKKLQIEKFLNVLPKLEQRLFNAALRNKDDARSCLEEVLGEKQDRLVGYILHKSLQKFETPIVSELLQIALNDNPQYLHCLDQEGIPLKSKLSGELLSEYAEFACEEAPIQYSERPIKMTSLKSELVSRLLAAAMREAKNVKKNFKTLIEEAVVLKQEEVMGYILHGLLNYFICKKPTLLKSDEKQNFKDFCELMEIALKANPNFINSVNLFGESLLFYACLVRAPSLWLNFFVQRDADLFFIWPRTKQSILQILCGEYEEFQKHQKIIRHFIRRMMEKRHYAPLLYGSEDNFSPLQILCKQLQQEKRILRDRKEINCTVIEEKCGSDLEDFFAESIFDHTSKEKSSRDESIFPSRTVQVISLRSLNTPQERNRRLKQEWVFYSCMKLVRAIPSQSNVEEAKQLRAHVDQVWSEAKEYLSRESQLMRFKVEDSYAIQGMDLASQLFRMDQGLDVGGKQGAHKSDSMSLILYHLESFLRSEKAMSESWNLIQPIFSNCCYFVNKIAPRIYVDILQYPEQEGEIAVEAAEMVFKRTDEEFANAENKEEITEQILNLGWSGHMVAVGVRKKAEDRYSLVVANGGGQLHMYHAKYNASHHQPIKMSEGNREDVKKALTQMMIVSSSLSKPGKEEEDHSEKAKMFYDSIKDLQEIYDYNLPLARKQPTGNCSLHNIKELIYYVIQRKEALIQRRHCEDVDEPIQPQSTANRLSRHYRQRGKQDYENSFISEEAKVAFDNQLPESIPSLCKLPHQLILKGQNCIYKLPFDEEGSMIYKIEKAHFIQAFRSEHRRSYASIYYDSCQKQFIFASFGLIEGLKRLQENDIIYLGDQQLLATTKI